MTLETGAEAPETTLRFAQTATLGEFGRLSLKNGLLNIVTLTLYRFWGKTQVRRRLWSTTTLNGEAFEYTGRGKELFLGFLLALAVLVAPLLIAMFMAQMLPPMIGIPLVFAIYICLLFVLGVGQFTAFRYLASRTSWRGVRFHLAGSPVAFAKAFFGYTLLSIVSFGWFAPAANRRLSGLLWGALRFGDRKVAFDLIEARKEQVYGAYAIGICVTFGVYMALTVGMVMIIAGLSAAGGLDPADPSKMAFIGIFPLVTILIVVPAAILAFAPYHAAALRSVVAGISFEGVRFRMNVTGTAMAGLIFSNLALLIVTLGFLMPFVEARTWKFLVSRLEATGAFDLTTVHQSADWSPRVGEGIADAFGLATV